MDSGNEAKAVPAVVAPVLERTTSDSEQPLLCYADACDHTDASIKALLYEVTGMPKVLIELALQYCNYSPFSLILGDLAYAESKWKKAFGHYSDAASLNCAVAMGKLSQFYMFSYGATTVDWKRADELITRCEKLTCPQAGLWRGLLHIERASWDQSPQGVMRAVESWRTARDHDFMARTLVLFGELVLKRRENEANRAALKELRPEMERLAQNDPLWSWIVGVLVYDHGFGADRTVLHTAFSHVERAANEQLAIALRTLGIYYEEGRSVIANGVIARQFVAKAVALRYPPAITTLGYLEFNGIGGGKNQENAIKLFLEAAELGHSKGLFNCATCYRDGLGCAVSHELAYKYNLQAAAMGHLDAMVNCGVHCETGQGRPEGKDAKEALEWYLQAAKLGKSAAYIRVARAYETGNGTEADPQLAMRWYLKAQESGSATASLAVRRMRRDFPDIVWLVEDAKSA